MPPSKNVGQIALLMSLVGRLDGRSVGRLAGRSVRLSVGRSYILRSLSLTLFIAKR